MNERMKEEREIHLFYIKLTDYKIIFQAYKFDFFVVLFKQFPIFNFFQFNYLRVRNIVALNIINVLFIKYIL